MNAMLHWFTSAEWEQIVKALLHSLWQSTVVALALAVVMRRLSNPVSRYRCSLAALVVVVIAGVLTWAVINSFERQKPASISIQPVAQNQTAPGYVPPLNLGSSDKIIVVVNRLPATTSLRWTAWLALVWLAGAAVMLTRAGVKVAGAEKLRRSCRPLNDERVEKMLAEARRAIGLAKQVRIGVTDKLTSPAVVGLFVPMLILPLSLLTTLTPEQIQFVLLHELAHIRRGDYLANLFQFFAESLLFFNPAVWWISHQVRREREACCDALAIELSGAPVDYARTLVQVAENMLQPAPAAALALGSKREPSSLIDRVQRLLVPGYRPSLRLTWRAMLAALVLGGLLLVLSATGTRLTVAAIITPTTLTPATNELAQTSSTVQTNLTSEELSATVKQNAKKPLGVTSTNEIVRDYVSSTNLSTRIFKVDPKIFASIFPKQSGGNSEMRSGDMEALRKYLFDAGLPTMHSPNSMSYDENTGTLVVQSTLKDLDAVGNVLQTLSEKNKKTSVLDGGPQINIKAEFIELSSSGSDIYLGSVSTSATNLTGRNLTSNTPTMAFPFNPTGSSPINVNPQTAKVTGILSPAQASIVRAALKSNPRTVVVAAPTMRTLSDRRAQIQIGDTLTILKGINPLALTRPGITKTNETDPYLLEQTFFGTMLDIVPHLSADGYTIQLTAIPKITAFLGYYKPTTNVTIYVNGKKQTTVPPLPRFYSDSLTNSATVWDGQTLVMGGMISEQKVDATDKVPVLGNLPGFLGRAFRSKSSKTIRKNVMVFITPTLLDAAGNRIHTDEDMMPFTKQGSPVQPE